MAQRSVGKGVTPVTTLLARGSWDASRKGGNKAKNEREIILAKDGENMVELSPTRKRNLI